ncbi:MAG: hypothetical protein M1840_000708 [Geoglossum simile]|nr:MAG: hypothetical protein M1840_000708 [Geoglossum simile]
MADARGKAKTVEITIKDAGERGPAPQRKDDIAQTNAAADGSPFHTGRVDTQIIIYIPETGSEPLGHGTDVEIRGSVATSGLIAREDRVVADLHEQTNFVSENNGLGRMVWRGVFRTFQFPPNFHAYIYEEGGIGETKMILNRAINFAEESNNDHQWGFWTWFDSSPQDANFKARPQAMRVCLAEDESTKLLSERLPQLEGLLASHTVVSPLIDDSETPPGELGTLVGFLKDFLHEYVTRFIDGYHTSLSLQWPFSFEQHLRIVYLLRETNLFTALIAVFAGTELVLEKKQQAGLELAGDEQEGFLRGRADYYAHKHTEEKEEH